MRPISRRTFLTGSAGVVVAAVLGGYELKQHPTALHSLGLTNSPDASVADSHARIESGMLESRHMGRPVAWTYSMPATAPLATVFCLHGRGDSHNDPFTTLHLPDFADFETHDVFARQDLIESLPVFIACGSGDPFFKAGKQFAAGFQNVEAHFVDGYHDAAFWRSQSAAALRFIARALQI